MDDDPSSTIPFNWEGFKVGNVKKNTIRWKWTDDSKKFFRDPSSFETVYISRWYLRTIVNWFISLVNNIIKTNINNSKSDKYSNQIHFQCYHFSDFEIRKFLKLRFHMWFCSHRIIKKWNEYSESQQNRHGFLVSHNWLSQTGTRD